MATFSEFLYQLRKEKNLTQSELAEKLGITNKAVSKWETGEAMPDTAQLFPLAEILGVSVDELLRGERNLAQSGAEHTPPEEDENIVFSSGNDRVKITTDGTVYVNNVKVAHPPRTFLDKISGCVCASLMAVSIVLYVILGATLQIWHPLWCLPASAALGCGVISCALELFDRAKKEHKRAKGENPYTGNLCGIVMCVSLIVFLCVASVCDMWEIMWISPATGVCVSMILGTIGGVFGNKKEK